MQEDINQKTIAVCIKADKVTARLFRDVLRALLRRIRAQRQKHTHVRDPDIVSHGKKTLKELQTQGHELTSMEITEDNIKSFERSARKYNVDFSLKKDRTTTPPQFYVFFKARDVKLMEAAFRDYTRETVREKPSVREKLQSFVRYKKANREREKIKHRNRSEVL